MLLVKLRQWVRGAPGNAAAALSTLFYDEDVYLETQLSVGLCPAKTRWEYRA